MPRPWRSWSASTATSSPRGSRSAVRTISRSAAQRAIIGDALARYKQGSALPHVILDRTGRVVGRITLNGIVRGPFQSCSMGYWVSASDNGRGLATAAVREITGVAFGELGLHRIQAETLLHNIRSQRVLERGG